jgi:hypothetical protein
VEEELKKLRADYQIISDSLVFYTTNKKELNNKLFHCHKENEDLKHQIEVMQIRHYESLQAAWLIQPTSSVDLELLQQKQREVILITKERDQYKTMANQLNLQMIGKLDHFQTLARA